MATSLAPGPRVFTSAFEAGYELAAVIRRLPRLVAVYALGRLDPPLRENVMVAVSQVNACRGCTYAHVRWARRSGVAGEELEAIDRGRVDLLDRRSQAAIAYATALATARFLADRHDLEAGAAEALIPPEIEAVEALARMITFANLTVNTAEAVIDRVRAAARAARRPRGRRR